MTDTFIKTNQLHWDDRTDLHIQTKDTPAGYNITAFINGENTLYAHEQEALGNVSGKSLLHLQCHIGLDSLSWARLGAQVTAVDLSPKSIAYARELSETIKVPATFIESDIYSLPEKLDEPFDIVYTSRGVLMWLPDLDKWAKIVAHYLKHNGVFYLYEDHPVTDCFEVENNQLVAKHTYFDQTVQTNETSGSYTDRTVKLANPTNHQWLHKLSDIISALAKAGLTITRMSEFEYSFFKRHACMTKNEDGTWHLPSNIPTVPLSYALMATKK